MYAPAIHDERQTLRNYIEVQLDAIRNAGYGLTEEQARQRPLASALSVSGVMKHAAYVLKMRLAAAGVLEEAPVFEDFYKSFALTDDESLDDLKVEYSELAALYLDLLDHIDLDAVIQVPPAPWYGRTTAESAAMRYLVVHDLEEFARHAGHADIIREQIDGAQAGALYLAVAGLPANDFLTPWSPSQP